MLSLHPNPATKLAEKASVIYVLCTNQQAVTHSKKQCR